MTTEVYDADYDDPKVDHLAERRELQRQISGLRIKLSSAISGRETFMNAYSGLLDGLISGEVTVPGLQGAGQAPLDSAIGEGAQARIDELEGELKAIQKAATELRSDNSKLSDEVEGLIADAARNRSAVSQLKSQFRALLENVKKIHAEELTALKVEHEELTRQSHENHQTAISDLNTIHEGDRSNLIAGHETAIQEVKDDGERQRAALVSSHESTVSDLNDSHERNVAGINSAHDLVVTGLKSNHEQEVTTLNESHDLVVTGLKADHAQEVVALNESHELVVTGLKEDAERARIAAEKLFNDTVAAHEAEIVRLNADHEAQVNRERAEAKAREDGLKEDYRILEESIPPQLKAAEAKGRDIGLGLSQSVVESANELGLDKLSSPALSSLRSLV